MHSQNAIEAYTKALKQAQKEVKELTAAGKPAFPQVLDDILPSLESDVYQDIGMIEIPADRIVGTKTAGRITAFNANFMPLLDIDTEFATKWMNLCDAHLSDVGIREPILCYEYLCNFYVQEGNKRVSVLRSFEAPRIPGNVRRIMPQPSEEPRIKAYYEFLEFYKDAGIYSVQYRVPGQYAKLLSHLGKARGERWTQQEQRTFSAYLHYFQDAFYAQGGNDLGMLPEEALLLWLEIYPYEDLGKMSASKLRKSLAGIWDDLKVLNQHHPVQVNTAPVSTEAKSGLLNWLLPSKEYIRVAFIHQLTPHASSWTKGHDDGSQYLERHMAGVVDIRSYYNANTPEDADRLIERAIAEGAELVFTTTPRLNKATLKAAVQHPKIKFFNCSVDVPYSSVRSYYCRIYEAKFITGAIAGAMANNDRIGYIGSYPIYGVPASINAFALGAQMTNPRAKIDLRWSCQKGDPVKDFIDAGYQVISNRDVPTPYMNYLEFGEYGTYFVEDDKSLTPLASPCWLWGSFYERVIRTILAGNWENGKDQSKAMNYWWGMDSGVIDVEFSKTIPESMRYLADILRYSLAHGTLDIFHRRITAQDGTVKNDGSRHFTADELLHMDWLCDNIDGCIPQFHEIEPFAQPMVRELGVYKDLIPPEKEANTL